MFLPFLLTQRLRGTLPKAFDTKQPMVFLVPALQFPVVSVPGFSAVRLCDPRCFSLPPEACFPWPERENQGQRLLSMTTECNPLLRAAPSFNVLFRGSCYNNRYCLKFPSNWGIKESVTAQNGALLQRVAKQRLENQTLCSPVKILLLICDTEAFFMLQLVKRRIISFHPADCLRSYKISTEEQLK